MYGSLNLKRSYLWSVLLLTSRRKFLYKCHVEGSVFCVADVCEAQLLFCVKNAITSVMKIDTVGRFSDRKQLSNFTILSAEWFWFWGSES